MRRPCATCSQSSVAGRQCPRREWHGRRRRWELQKRQGNVRFVPEFPSSCTCGHLALDKRKYKSLTRPPFSQVPGSLASAVLQDVPRPRGRASFSGGGFSEYFERPILPGHCGIRFPQTFGDHYRGLYKCARCCDLTFSYFIICAAVRVVATPTSPRKRPNSQSSYRNMFIVARAAHPLRSFGVSFPTPCSFRSASSILKHPADCQCPDSGGHNLADQ
jgi:hypothetical protein